ncbi:Protein scabrous [Lucilia cuprina]|uniref:Protein scabrous n=1 Tax=Lucilia cuprina TaxID=7375 RepID=A0A0L0BMC4_LUCCU|nr:Protein scabrous [Lucilia cuprina]KNC21196.1 Protein scabrous [Lucilia cuprina]
MSLTNCSLLAVIKPLITVVLLTTGGFAGLTQASVINDMNNIMRDISTEVNTMSSPTTASAGMTTTTIRQMILRNSDGKKDNSDNYVNLDNTNDESISYSETSSGEILRFVNDNDNVNEDNDNNDDFIDMSIYNDKNNNNNNEIFSGNSIRSDNDISMSNTKNNYQIIDNNNDNSNYIESLTLRDQVRLLSKQLNVLMNRRREDYELLERNLRKSLRITQNNQPQQQHQQQNQQQQSISNDLDLRNELENLRQEVQNLRNSHQLTDGSSNKERLTIEWLQQSIGELRKQLVELQQIASNAMRDVTTRTQSWEDLTTIRSDFQQLKLELAALKERQQQTDVYVRELREETEQQEEEFQHFIIQNKQMYAKQTDDSSKTTTTAKHDKTTDVDTNTSHLSTSESLEEDEDNNKDIKETSSLTQLADHRRRHCRFQRQQLHELQLSQRQLKRQFNELKYHRIAERVRSIEIEQHRIADANFNLSRQIASLDKLHSSMLELLEDVENVQTKVDKTVPELRHEISKLEFANAQLMSEQNLVREEGKNVARSLQAMAVSVSTLQDERDGIRRMQSGVSEMRTKLDRLQTMVEDVQRAIQHRQHRGYGNKDNKKFLHHHNNTSYAEQETTTTTTGTPTQNAESLVAKLENVEAQFESIIEKLPKDCSEVTPTATNANGGLYLIAPSAERHPLMAHCSSDGWTTIQRRYDGSADFNRSWEDYANGFGSPAGEFWMGNEQLHHLTLNNCTRLRVVMQDIYDNVWLADYTQFYISSRSDGYRLHIGGYSGNASDALDYQQGMQFSAIDVDRDISQTHCAANYEGGWWFSHCQHANLNGRYNLGLTWFDAARNEWIAVKSSQMMVKRQSTSTCQYIQESLASTTKASATMTTTTTTATTTTSASSSATINSNKSIPLNNLRIPGQTSSL